MPWPARILTAVVILSNVLGNLALSIGMKTAFFSPMVLLGVVLLIVWLLSRMALLSWADLSFVLPVTSIGYVISALFAKVFLAEQITATRWLGTLLIVSGMLLVAFTKPRKVGIV